MVLPFQARFPRDLVARLAPRETASRRHYRPIYSLHRWWARRPGSVFRSILLTAFAGADQTPEDVAHSYFEPRGGGVLEGKLIVDPFMGGGTTIFEALRLGASVVGVDLNPIAWWIVRQSISPINLEALQQAYQQVKDSVADRLLSYYQTHCPLCGKPAEGLYFFWVKELVCPTCGQPFLLHPDFRLARLGSGEYVVYCPACGLVERATAVNEARDCSRCGHRYVPAEGHVNRGRYHCPHCQAAGTVVAAVRNREQPLPHQLVAVEYYCQEHGRGYKQADEIDWARYQQARRELARLETELQLPSQPIRPGTNTDQMRNHHYHYWRDMFNDRQLLGLGLLLNAVMEVEAANARELLLTLLSEILDYNNMLCTYNYSYRKIGNLFGLHAFNVSMRSVENNIWGGTYGTGTFSKYFAKLRAAKEYARCPTELDDEGHRYRLPTERVALKPVSCSGSELNLSEQALAEPSAVLLCRDARKLPLPDGVADAIITDPPYFDNVMYSELSEFYYVWLHAPLKNTYDQFRSPQLDASAEVVTNPKRGKRKADYLAGLTQVFAECRRVLKPGAPLVFTFHHRSIEAWVVLLAALTHAGFVVKSTGAVHAEMPSSIHIRGKRAPRIDMVVCCRCAAGAEVSVQAGAPMGKDILSRWWRELQTEELGLEDTRVVLLGKTLKLLSARAVHEGFDAREAQRVLKLADELGRRSSE